MTAGMYKYVSDLAVDERTRQGVLDYAVNPYELVFYDEGLSSVVTVARSKKTGNMWLANNGKVDASTRVDMPTQLLVAHLPFVFQPEPDKVLVIGLASGITAGSVTLHSAANSIDIVELEPAVVAASHLFDDVNNQPLEDPRVQLIANDGRNHLTLTPDGTYDLVVSEPSNPWLTGVSNLFTQEFFEMGKAKLSENGVWSQWVQMYGIDTDDLRTLLGTFADVFPHVLLFSTIEDADIVMIGSEKPLDLTVDLVQQMMNNDQAVHEDLALIECAEPEDLLTRLYLNRDQIVTFSEGSPKNTDDNMNIEYSAPLHLHDSTAAGNFFELLNDSKGRQTIPLHAVNGPEGHLRLAEAYGRREDWLRGLITLKAADELDPTNPQIEILYNEYQSALAETLAEE